MPTRINENVLTRTKFNDIHIGHLFFAHNTVWTRTSYDSATCVTPHRYGSCNFILDKNDEYVLAIKGEAVETFIRNLNMPINNICTEDENCPFCDHKETQPKSV